jgi:hypothetical protein
VLRSAREQADLSDTGTEPARQPTAQTSSSDAPSRWRGWWPRLSWCAGVPVAGAALFWGYLWQSRTYPVTSDGASNALQAWDMLHGNLLLHGWYLSDVSFYTTELPEYMLVETVRGLRPDVVHISAALTYTLLVLLAALVARGQARGREGLVRALVAGGIMVAPQLEPGTRVLLLSPDHTGTGVPILLMLLLVDRLRPRWYVPVAACLLLTVTQVADPLGTYAATAPLLLVGAGRASSEVVRGRRPSASRWFDASLAVAAAASVALAHVVLATVQAHGGFFVHPVAGGTGFASSSVLPTQSWVLTECVLILFGADFFGQQFGLAAGLSLLHLVGVALFAWGLCAGLRRFFGGADRVTQVLVAGTLITLAAGLFGTHMVDVSGAHEIAVVLPFGAALAGRTLGGRLVQARLEPVLGVVLACYLAALGYNAAQPSQPAGGQALAGWLAAHGLKQGLAGYWQANSTTLASGGRIVLAPVSGGGADAYAWESKESWYDPAVWYANFVVTVSQPPQEARYAQPSVVRHVFGRPAHTYHFQQYTIMVWNKNLLYQVSQPPPE